VSRRERFARAFYEQASSDWSVYDALTKLALPRCHQLHYLQMACEKLGKAYRLLHPACDVNDVVTHHVGFERFINSYLRSPAMVSEYHGKQARHREVCKTSRALAREIEKLAPSVDRGARPENAEYPWEHGSMVLVPCRYDFSALSLLDQPGGRAFLKLIARAFREYPVPAG
jgi:hypothetical protein